MMWGQVKVVVGAAVGIVAVVAGVLFIMVRGGGGVRAHDAAVAVKGAEPVVGVTAAPTSMPVVTTRPEGVDAAALVREVRAKEEWINNVSSFHLKVHTVWSKSPEAWAKRLAELKRQFPRMTVDETTFPRDLGLTNEDRVEVAWDQKRLFYVDDAPALDQEMRIWDGTRGFAHYESYYHDQESFAILKSTTSVRNSMSGMSWPRLGTAQLWWAGGRRMESFEPAESFRCVRIEPVEGEMCYMLCTTGLNFERLSIGVRDHLLRKLETGLAAGNPRQWECLQAAAKKRGMSFEDYAALRAWEISLPEQEKLEFVKEALSETYVTAKPGAAHWTSDWTELKPGCWFPKKQAYEIYDNDAKRDGPDATAYARTWVMTRREIHVDEVAIDAALPDSMFVMDFKEGVTVRDETHDPPLTYKYKKEMPAEEWANIVNTAAREKSEQDAAKKLHDGIVGTAAPAFPELGMWVNSEPLTWEGLKGKVVVLDFFAEWCAPCQNDLPAAMEVHENREKSGITVVGIHPAGSRPAVVERFLKDFKIEYPVCVDVKGMDAHAWGELYAGYHVSYIPYAVVVDGEGKVRGCGSLQEVLRIARELAGGGNSGKK